MMSDSQLNVENKRILCCAPDAVGHVIPTLTLAEHFAKRNEVFFINFNPNIILRKKHNIKSIYVNNLNDSIESLKEDVNFFLKIIDEISPDITISDWNYVFQIAAKIKNVICNISILRVELFIGYKIINYQVDDKFCLSDKTDLEIINETLSYFNEYPISDFRELLIGDLNVIPGIPEMDRLDFPLLDKYTNVEYIGLLYHDFFSKIIDIKKILEWIDCHKHKKVVLVTFGNAWGSTMLYKRILEIISKDSALAGIFVIPHDGIRERIQSEVNNDNILILPFIKNLLDIFKRVDLVIHHCGHAISLLAMLAGKPSIIFPSGHYDRDDNAVRLEQLGVCYRFASTLLSFDLQNLIHEAIQDVQMMERVDHFQKVVEWYTINRGAPYLDKCVRQKFF